MTSSRPGRRAAATAALAAVTAGLCGAGQLPAALADPAPVFGASIQLNPGETLPLALDRAERAYGQLHEVRVFQNAPDPRVFDTLGDRSGIISIRLSPAQVLSGAYDAQFRAFFAAAPTDHPTWWSYYHEADVDYATGGLTDLPQFRAAWDRVAQLARQAANPMLRTTVIFVGWSANPRSGRALTDYLPRRDLFDVVAFDNYNTVATSAGSYGTPSDAVDLDRAAAAALGKPFGVAEYGSVVVGADVLGRADYVRQFARTAAGEGAQFVSYYDSNEYGAGPDYRLLDAPSRAAMADVAAGTPVTAPAAPAGVTVAGGQGTLAVAWQPTDAHGSPVTGWTVQAVDPATGQPVGVAVPTGPTSAAVQGLVDGQPYSVTVRATNAVGTGASSVPVVGLAGGSATAPGAPVVLAAQPMPGAVSLRWSAPAATGGAPVLSWTVSAVDTATGARTGTIRVAAAATTATVGGLQNGRAYALEVTAANAFGPGVPALSAPAVPFSAPAAPGTPTVVAGDRSVTASWGAPSVDGGKAPTGYLLTALSPWGRVLATATVPGSATSGSIGGLANGQPVTVTVTATNGLTGPASSRSAQVVPATVPTAPTAHAWGGSWSDGIVTAVASWSSPSSAGGSPVTGFRVEVYGDGSALPLQVLSLPASAHRVVVDGLTRKASYRFVVTAVNAVGAGEPSDPAVATAN